MNRCAAPTPGIVPPHILERLALSTDPQLQQVAARALHTLVATERLRGHRHALGVVAPHVVLPVGAKRRSVYDAQHRERLPGRLARTEGQPPVVDVAVNEAYDATGATFDLFFEEYERNSIDDRGMRLESTVHYGRDYDNAFWDGRQMVCGDGDGVIFNRFTAAVEVIGHELAHGVIEFEANLEYEGQSGALNESFADVLGVLVKQRLLQQTAAEANWLMGEGLFTAQVDGVALRSLAAPGTAYDDPRLGKDPQPAHMRDYLDTPLDNGGVHINSGIPNRAFHLTATALGGFAWQRAGKIWYITLRDRLRGRSEFRDAARVTLDVAAELYGKDSVEERAVRDAWIAVGL